MGARIAMESKKRKLMIEIQWLAFQMASIVIIGFIGSIILGSSVHFDSYSDFNYAVMMIGWISTGVSSLFLFAFSEIIQILHDIRKNK